MTLQHYRRHPEGRTSLGLYPLRPDGSIRWLAIDVDKNDVSLPLCVIDALRELGMTIGVYLERSKGKGYHVLVLLSDWAPAYLLRRIAKAALQVAGLPPTTEIFPKQDRLSEKVRYGSYLNVPYFAKRN